MIKLKTAETQSKKKVQDKRETFKGGGGERFANRSWKLHKDNSSQRNLEKRRGEG